MRWTHPIIQDLPFMPGVHMFPLRTAWCTAEQKIVKRIVYGWRRPTLFSWSVSCTSDLSQHPLASWLLASQSWFEGTPETYSCFVGETYRSPTGFWQMFPWSPLCHSDRTHAGTIGPTFPTCAENPRRIPRSHVWRSPPVHRASAVKRSSVLG